MNFVSGATGYRGGPFAAAPVPETVRAARQRRGRARIAAALEGFFARTLDLPGGAR